MKFNALYSLQVPQQQEQITFGLTIPTLRITEPIGRIPRGVKVLVTQTPQTTRASILQACTQIATEICDRFGIDGDRLVYLQYCPLTEIADRQQPIDIDDWSLVCHHQHPQDIRWLGLGVEEVRDLLDFIEAYDAR